MKVLVTGNQGYIGSVLTEILLTKGYDVVGYDVGYYVGCELLPIARLQGQITKDIRDINKNDFNCVFLLLVVMHPSLGVALW